MNGGLGVLLLPPKKPFIFAHSFENIGPPAITALTMATIRAASSRTILPVDFRALPDGRDQSDVFYSVTEVAKEGMLLFQKVE